MAIKMSNKKVKGTKIRKPWYDKINTILMVLSILAVIVAALYTLAPIGGFMAGCFVGVLGLLLVLISVFSFFTIWAVEGYRNLVSKVFTTAGKIFDGSVKFKEIVANPYPIIMSVAGSICVAFLVVSIILQVKKGSEDIHHEHRGKLITSIVLSSLFIIFTIISAITLFAIK